MPTVTEWGTAIWTSLTSALAMVFAFIPKLLGFLVILLVGWIIASLLEKGVTLLLRKVGFDRFSERIGLQRFERNMNLRMDPAALLGKIVFWFILLVFLVPAFDALSLNSVSTLLNQVIAYIPNVFVAIIILFLGTLFANFVASIVRGATATANVGNPNLFANVAQYAILGFVAIIALTQLQIAPALMQTLFTAIVGALALAFGLSFGLGGRESAQRWLARGESQLTTASAQYRAKRITNEARATTNSGNTNYDNTNQNYNTNATNQGLANSARQAYETPTTNQNYNANQNPGTYTDQSAQYSNYTQKPYTQEQPNTPQKPYSDEPTQRFRQ